MRSSRRPPGPRWGRSCDRASRRVVVLRQDGGHGEPERAGLEGQPGPGSGQRALHGEPVHDGVQEPGARFDLSGCPDAFVLQCLQPPFEPADPEALEREERRSGCLRRRRSDVGVVQGCPVLPCCSAVSTAREDELEAGLEALRRALRDVGDRVVRISSVCRPATTVSSSSCCVGKKCRSDPVLTPARAATARTLSRAVGFSPSIVAAATRIRDLVSEVVGSSMTAILPEQCHVVLACHPH